MGFVRLISTDGEGHGRWQFYEPVDGGGMMEMDAQNGTGTGATTNHGGSRSWGDSADLAAIESYGKANGIRFQRIMSDLMAYETWLGDALAWLPGSDFWIEYEGLEIGFSILGFGPPYSRLCVHKDTDKRVFPTNANGQFPLTALEKDVLETCHDALPKLTRTIAQELSPSYGDEQRAKHPETSSKAAAEIDAENAAELAEKPSESIFDVKLKEREWKDFLDRLEKRLAAQDLAEKEDKLP